MISAPLVISILGMGYLIGSIPSAYIMMHLLKRQDLRKLGTGNVTATAAIIHGGKLPGLLSILGELLKTGLCLYIAHLWVGEVWAYLVILLAAGVGEMWSIWLGGAGGQGQTIFGAGFLLLCPVPFALAALFFLMPYFITRRIRLANQIFHLAIPVMFLLAGLFNPAPFGLGQHSWGYALAGAASCVLFFAKYRPETDDILQAQACSANSRPG
jgi:glycerol-3-phosphate acyltransferase PlsY